MFYEEAKIDEILKCGQCKRKLDEPRIIPCGKAVCNACFETILKSTNEKDNTFDCILCKATHKNAEFPVSESLKKY